MRERRKEFKWLRRCSFILFCVNGVVNYVLDLCFSNKYCWEKKRNLENLYYCDEEY